MTDQQQGTSITQDETNTGYNHLNTEQEIAIFVAGAFSFTLSIVGSGTIMFLLIKTGKWKTELQQRLVAGLSIMDLMVTTSIAFMPFGLPTETGRLFAKGTFTTCAWAGFFFQFYLGGALYNLILALYYCLMITYGWKEDQIKKWMEPWAHILCFGTPLLLSCVRIRQDLFNPDPFNGICALRVYPADCLLQDEVECERGNKYTPTRPIVTTLYLMTVLVGVYFTARVFFSVRNQTRRNLRYSSQGLNPSQQRRVKAVGKQAILYTAAFLNGFVAVMLDTITDSVISSSIDSTKELKDEPALFPTMFIINFLFPLQGFWNVLVYIRPKVMAWKQSNQDRSWFWSFQMVLSGQVPTTVSRRNTLGSKKTVSKDGFETSGEEGREENQNGLLRVASENRVVET